MRTAPPWTLALAAALLPACASATPAPWEDDDSGGGYGSPGIFIEAGALRGFENFDTAGSTIRARDGDVGFLGRLGVRLGESAAVDVSVEDAAGFRLDDGSVKADIDVRSVVAEGRWYLSDGILEPYLLGGVGWAKADAREFDLDGTAAFYRAGIGADLYVNPGFGFFAEVNYNRMTGDLRDLDHYDAILGIILKF